MADNSKLSSRFKQNDSDIEKPKTLQKKFVLAKNAVQSELNSSSAKPVSDKEVQSVNIEKFSPEFENFDEEELKKSLLDKVDSIPVWFEYTADRQKSLIKSFVEKKIISENLTLSDEQKETLIDKLFTSIMGFGPLDYLIARENVDAVFVNGTNSVHIEIGGKILNTEMNINEKQMKFIINNISSMSGTNIDNSQNIWNLTVNNLRITVIMPSISQCGFNITIRKFCQSSMEVLLKKNMMTKEIFDFLVSIVASGKNIVISGDINTGKSSLLEALIFSCLLNKRVALFEEFQAISVCGNFLMKFVTGRTSDDYHLLTSDVLKMMPEYIIVDFNSAVPELSEVSGGIFTLRAASVESALSKLMSGFIAYEHLPDKAAKMRVYTNYDYIVQINTCKDGVKRVTSIVELTPARTSALSVKVIAKFVDGDYVTEIPQPLTSIRAESLIAQEGSMSGRFAGQN